LVQVEIRDLGDGDVEPRAHAIAKRADDLPACL